MKLSLPAPYLYGAAALASFTCGWFSHSVLIYRPHLAADRRVALKASEGNRKTEHTTTAIASSVRDSHDTKQEQVHAVTTSIIRAIPLYLPSSGSGMVSGGVCPEPARPGVPGDGSKGGEGDRGIPRAVPPDSLPVGFVRLHDYAALGVAPPVPTPSGEPLGAASGIGLPELAGTIAHNYGVSLGYKAEVMAWREWYAKEASAWEANRLK